jgi:hypothetical protein
MPYPKGKPKAKTGGRKAGMPNKLTADAKEAFRLAAEGVGGVEALTEWARVSPDKFWPLYARLIPVDHTTAGQPLQSTPSAIRVELISVTPES